MYIGKLNDRLPGLRVAARDKRSKTVLCEDVLSSLPAAFHWQDFPSGGIALVVSLPVSVPVDAVRLCFDPSSHPKRVALCDKSGKEQFRYEGETGRDMAAKEVTVPVADTLDGFVITVDSDFTDVTVTELSFFGRQAEVGPSLFPEPKSAAFTGETFPATLLSRFTACPTADKAAVVFAEKLAENEKLTAENGDFFVMEEDPSVGKNGYRLTVGKNGYRLEVGKTGVRLYASDARGFVIGAETIVASTMVPPCIINPDLSRRFLMSSKIA